MAELDDNRELESQAAEITEPVEPVIVHKGPRPVRRVVDEPAKSGRQKKAKTKKPGPGSNPQKKGKPEPAKAKSGQAGREGAGRHPAVR